MELSDKPVTIEIETYNFNNRGPTITHILWILVTAVPLVDETEIRVLY